MIVILAWAGALVLALVLLTIVGLEFRGHAQRLSATLSAVQRDLLPRVAAVAAGLRTSTQQGQTASPTERDIPESTPGASGRHRAGP